MKNRSFVLSAIILALGGFFAKAIGAFYKIPLTNILGSSGMGIYYLIFPVYSLILTFSSSGINVALATEVAKCRKLRHRYNEQKLLRVALIFTFCLSLFFTILILMIAKPIAIAQGNIHAKLGYIAIAPAIIISSIISALRGYFQGVENMVPTTVSMIIEQIIKLSVGLILAHKLCAYGIEYAVLGAIIGVTISEVVALIIICANFFTYKGQLYFNYRNKLYKGKRKVQERFFLKNNKILSRCTGKTNIKYLSCSSKKVRYTNKIALKKIVKILIPTTFSSIILPIATMIDSFLILNILINIGFSSHLSTSIYGLYGGVVQSLISLPIILISAISTTIIPSLSGVVEDNVSEVNKKVSVFIKTTLTLSILMTCLFFVFAKDILTFLYGGGLGTDIVDELNFATKMLRFASISIIYYAFLQTYSAIFQTIGKAHIPFWVMFGSLIIRVLFTLVLVKIPNINIFGAIISNILFLSITTLVMTLFIRKYIDLHFRFMANLLLPIIIGIITIVVMSVCYMGLKNLMNYLMSTIISSIIGIVMFVITIYFSNVFDQKEKRKYFKKQKKWIK